MSNWEIVKYDKLGIVEIREPSLLAMVPGGLEASSADLTDEFMPTNYVCAQNLSCPDINACTTNVVC